MHERKPRVLVTGGAGYLGSTLVPRLLADGFSVRVLDTLRYGGRSLLGVWSHPGFQFLRGDIRCGGNLPNFARFHPQGL